MTGVRTSLPSSVPTCLATGRTPVRTVVALCVTLGFATATWAQDGGDGITPPQVLTSVEATYPLAELAARREGTAILTVTIGTDGRVSDVEVAESAGEAFDHAALDAVRQWTFVPATQGGQPIVSRVHIPFRFVFAPEPSPPAIDAGAPSAGPPAVLPAPSTEPDGGIPPLEAAVPTGPEFSTVIRGKRTPPPRASSDFVLEREVLAAAPHRTAADLLGSAPGVYVSAPEGDAVGHEIYPRGFDAEHGQDIELTVGPVPVNQPSHVHGQGYSDLNFIIPETVRSLRVTEGVYDPRQGDFAVAGSVHFDLGVPDRGYHLKSSVGSFGKFRQLLLWAPEGEAEETFGAFAFQRSSGFGQNRGSQSVNAMAQFAFEGPSGVDGLIHVAAYGARASLAGVLRRDDVDAGRVDFYGSYPDPSANSQSAFASRYQAAVTLERASDDGGRTHLSVWALLAQFRGRFNFTGYLERSREQPQWLGRGDLIEQGNQDRGVGAILFHRTPRVRPFNWANGRLELGLSARTNEIEQVQNLLQAPQNETWDRRVDATIHGSDIGAYLDVDARLGPYVHLRGGVRGDVLHYDVDDRLGNFIPRFQRESHIVGYRRTALGLAAGPRATVEVEPLSWLLLLASYGEGYRSPQALQLEEGENAPFTKVRSMEAGFRLKPFGGEALSLSGAAYRTHLSNDLAFDPGEGRLERIGPTLRQGIAVHLLAKPWPWALASLSATYVHATLTAPPTATPENPTPAFERGQLLPYVPPWVLRGDVGVTRELTVGEHHVDLKAGAGATYLSPRPLPYGRFAEPVFLLDFSASARWRALELGLEIFNVLDSRYAASEYSFVSDWGTREAPTLIPARHFSAGPPRSVLASLSLHF